MKIGILGSGTVAQTLAGKLLERGHEVMVSSRDIDRQKEGLPSAKAFAEGKRKEGLKAKAGSFTEAAGFGEFIINALVGLSTIEVIRMIGKAPFTGKILLDVSNPLDFSKGFPPNIKYCNEPSLAERIQSELPETKVVKGLNMVNAYLMVNPERVHGQGDLFVAGNDKGAKEWIAETILKKDFLWKSVIDLGDIRSARGMEIYLILWLIMMNAFETPDFNIKAMR